MKVIAKTGFVPVKFLHSSPPYVAGEIGGLTPEQAREAVAKGQVALVPIAAGLETFEVPGPESVKAKPAAVESMPSLFEKADIPADWENLHHLKKVALAKQIAGLEKLDPPPGTKPLEYAEQIIRTEIENRAAAEAKAGGKDGDSAEGGGDLSPEKTANEETQTEQPPAPSAEGGGDPSPAS
jgi:hypothetical protein